MEGDVRVASEPVDPAENGVVRACASSHGVDHRETYGDSERLEHPEHDNTSCRHAGDRDLDMVDRGEAAPGVQVDEADRC